MSEAPLLSVENLNIRFNAGQRGENHAVRGVSFEMGRERLAIVGESGSGKSVSMRAVLGLLPSHASLHAETLAFKGQDLRALSPEHRRLLRGRSIAMIVQDPQQGFNPGQKIGAQIVEMVRWHRKLGRKAAIDEAGALLRQVHLNEVARVMNAYPHEVSGGMAQRAMIAMMLAGEPDLIVADEATSALDAVLRHRILELVEEIAAERNLGVILISHDLDLVARHTDRVVVMYAGRVMEEIASAELHHARHAYTRGLLACRPTGAFSDAPLPTLERDPTWLN